MGTVAFKELEGRQRKDILRRLSGVLQTLLSEEKRVSYNAAVVGSNDLVSSVKALPCCADTDHLVASDQESTRSVTIPIKCSLSLRERGIF